MSELDDLLEELEIEARERAWSLAYAGKFPNPTSNRTKDAVDIIDQLYPMTKHEQQEGRRLDHALNAATDADTFVALVKGRTVDSSRLDPKMVAYWQRYA